MVGVPIAFISGERLEDLEPFHPDRRVARAGDGRRAVADRKAEAAIDQTTRTAGREIRSNDFTLEFRDQLRTVRKVGPLEQILGMLPGMGSVKALAENKPDEADVAVEAIVAR